MKHRVHLVLIVLVLATSAPAQSGKLRPSQEYWTFWAEIDGQPSVYRLPLSGNRKLVSVGDTLYLLNKRNRILWSWVAGAPIWDRPVVDSQGTIYLIGPDLLWAAIDSTTGKQKWRSTANGRAAYSQIKAYRKDMYFVVTDMWGYRNSLRDRTIKDTLLLCQNNAVLWETEIPAHTKVHIFGSKVFLTYRRHGRVIRTRVLVPRKFGKPLSRISVHADYDGGPRVK